MTLRRRVAMLSRRLHVAGVALGSQPAVGTPRQRTPSADHKLGRHAFAADSEQAARNAGSPLGQALPGGKHECAAGGAAGDPCGACTETAQQIAGLQQDISAMRSLLQQLCASQAARVKSASVA